MKIFVQGRKRGYCVLYPSPTPAEFYDFAKDVQSINAQNKPYYYGKSLYSIAFSRDGKIFTKYVLGYDVQRSSLGNISFSVYIPDDKFLPGADIRKLLDNLSSEYFNSYACTFSIGDIQEDWNKLSAIANQYDSQLKPVDPLDIEHIDMGSQDAAYIYCSPEQLVEYFDNPYQKAYAPYSQVFFIEEEFQYKQEDPLSAFKHNPDAELSKQVDLYNKRYRIVLLPDPRISSVAVKRVSPDGHETPLFSNEHFYKKDELYIQWTKPYYHPAEKRGMIDTDTLKDDLEINESNRTVTVKSKELQIESKDIQLQVCLGNNSQIEVNCITCTNCQGEKVQLEGNQLHFKGEQLNQTWTIASNDPSIIIINNESFTPKSSQDIIKLKIDKKKKISFKLTDEKTNEPLKSVTISYLDNQNKECNLKGSSISFYNEEINQTYQFFFKSKGYVLKKEEICPKDAGEEIQINLIPSRKRKQEDSQSFYQPRSPENDKCTNKRNSWLSRNLISLILALCLVVSLLFNICFCIKFKREKDVWKTIEYLDGPKLLAKELKDFSDKNAVKENKDLVNRILEVKCHRDGIDKLDFRSNDGISLLRCPELFRFYDLINDSDSLLINKMENHIDSLWGENITDYPLKEITDTIDLFIKQINGSPIPESNNKIEDQALGPSKEKDFFEKIKI